MRERGLLNRKKRPDLVATWTYNPDRPGDHKKQEVARKGEGKTGAGHKKGPDNEHPPTPNTIRLGCENQRNDRVPQEYQGEKHSDPRFTKSNAGQIKDENNGQRTVSEEASESR
jgi:hypothetical protein